MTLDLSGSSAPRAGRGDDTFVYSQDVKCFQCGLVLGQLVGHLGLQPGPRTFQPSPGERPPSGFNPARPRCFRCGGSCFLDEVETTLRPGPAELEKPRRGRKPKPRPEQAV
jgi:hypothetical protein